MGDWWRSAGLGDNLDRVGFLRQFKSLPIGEGMNLSFDLAGRQQQLRCGTARVFFFVHFTNDVVNVICICIDRLPTHVREKGVETDLLPSQLLDGEPTPHTRGPP